MRVVAILASYNEERFIGTCLEHLFAQGVEAYLLDNCSTDRTVEIAERYLERGLIGIESFPRDEGVYRWGAILERKAELAETLEADWFMHADPDEFRLPPRTDRTLAQAFAEVDEQGYNAVNFLEFTFVPTREAPDHDHPHFQQTMRWYYPYLRNFPAQIKAWKRQPERVDLGRGGHRVRFDDLRLYPQPFKMRHYQFLSVPHLISKYVAMQYDAAALKRGAHGWRTRLGKQRIELPSQVELNVYTSDDDLDLSNPRTRHMTEDWLSPWEESYATLKEMRRHRNAILKLIRHRRNLVLAEIRHRRNLVLAEIRHRLAEIRHRRNVTLEHIIHRRNIIRGNIHAMKQKDARGLAKSASRRLSALYRRLRSEGQKP
jgi:glycosyltransferase involved in cell wall biosynthesis